MSHPVLTELQELTRSHRTGRKLLVSPTLNWGREWLRVLARAEGTWIGWEPMTLRALAGELARVPLERAGLRVASDVALEAVVGTATDAALAAGQVRGPLRDLVLAGGARRAIVDAVLELRVGGVTPNDLEAVGARGTASSLAAILLRYGQELAARRLADPAAVFEAALADFEAEAPLVLPDAVVLAPGLTPRGLPARLVRALLARGAHRMTGPVIGHELPAVAGLGCFQAATPTDEIREALRRVAEEGWPDDTVELVTTDPDAHGVALDAICRATGVRATFLHGVPLTCTRIGRALERWLEWLEEGLPADRIREALEAGELAPPPDLADAGVLSRELRALRIGWGRAQWEAARQRLEGVEWVAEWLRRQVNDDTRPEDTIRRRQEGEAILSGLRWLLDTVLAHAPEVPERGTAGTVLLGVPQLARGAQQWLQLVPGEGAAEERTLSRLTSRLDDVAREAGGIVPFRVALATIRQAVAELRAWTDIAPEQQPWASTGGHLHLTDLAHAGCTGRPHLFILGLDADRVSGPVMGTALLPDGLRHALGAGLLATADDRREEHQARLVGALATAAGRGEGATCTISWSIAGDLAGRQVAPAPAVLAAMRASLGDPELDFHALRARIGSPACAVPAPGRAPLDQRDLWLAALTDARGRLLDGTELVRESWPALVTAEPSLGALAPGAVPDPFRRAARPFSPTSLEQLSRCPLAWFYRHVLEIVPPEDHEYDRDQWLDPQARGLVLHRLYERAGRRFRSRQGELDSAGVYGELLAMVDDLVREWRDRRPVPSEAVFEAERRELQDAALTWLGMERAEASGRHAPHWVAFEERLEGAVASFRLPDGRLLPIHGRVDRVDEYPDGRLRAVDYKTGRADSYREVAKEGPLRGGRLLQPALYAAAVSGLHGGLPASFEYRFPTTAGQGVRLAFDGQAVQAAGPVVAGLVDHLTTGRFIPTTDDADCSWCEFRTICRVQKDDFGGVRASPRAAAAADRAPGDPAFAAMLRRRTPEAS